MLILLTVLHTFLMELVRTICLNIKTSYLGAHFLSSHHLNVWTNIDDVKRNFIFVTVGALRVETSNFPGLCCHVTPRDVFLTVECLINRLSPNINMHILLGILHIFGMVLVGRICTNIKTLHVWWSFPLTPWPVCLIKYGYCKEKLDACNYWGLKG